MGIKLPKGQALQGKGVNLEALAAASSTGINLDGLGASQSERDGQTKKYNNRKTAVGSLLFDSDLEAARYRVLKMLETAGAISELELQVPLEVAINGVKICKLIVDFRYLDTADGKRYVEDTKSEATRLKASYRLKRKLVFAVLGVVVLEVLTCNELLGSKRKDSAKLSPLRSIRKRTR